MEYSKRNLMSNVLCIIQARCSSTRLPFKVIKKINNEFMFIYQIKRVLLSKIIDNLVLATSISHDDDIIEDICIDNQVDCYRGSLCDVLSRYHEAAKLYNADYIVRLTADCPLIDASVIDKCIETIIKNDYDYVSNCHERTFADGMDVEVFNSKSLVITHKNASLPSEREHVTPYIWKNDKQFKLGILKDTEDLSDWRLTVDHAQDFELIENIVSHFDSRGVKNFSYVDIKKYLQDNKHLLSMNSQYACNATYRQCGTEAIVRRV